METCWYKISGRIEGTSCRGWVGRIDWEGTRLLTRPTEATMPIYITRHLTWPTEAAMPVYIKVKLMVTSINQQVNIVQSASGRWTLDTGQADICDNKNYTIHETKYAI